MKKAVLILLIFCSGITFAQLVTLNKVERTSENRDAFLYKITPDLPSAIYLGEIAVSGFSENDAEVFGIVYKKAKSIGANAFAWKPAPQIDDKISSFQPADYQLSLYYLPADQFPAEGNVVYLLGDAGKQQTISLNNRTVSIPARSYISFTIPAGGPVTVSTRKLFGSSIKLGASKDQPVQYFQISGFSVNANQGPGINLKSGDIIKLEKSYGQFLTTIYSYLNQEILP